jgi:uncharacterized protein involved in response to NO
MDQSMSMSALWALAFRPGFLLAALFAVLAVARWLLYLNGVTAWNLEINPYWWHGHEMIFGFALPVVAGFLLTAVATWTGTKGTTGWRLQLLFGLWLAARLLLWLAPSLAWLAWLAETLFLLLIVYELTTRVWSRRQWRNMWFPPLLLVLATLNAASYSLMEDPEQTAKLHFAAIWLITVFVVIIGGRVTPLFTANGLGLKLPAAPAWLEYSAIVSAIAVALCTLLLPSLDIRLLCLATGLLHLYRMTLWQGWKSLGEPLLWSMHLSYLCIPLTLFALAATGNDNADYRNLMHLLAIGTVAGMILAMMSRVSLGHTARPLVIPGWLAAAFGMVILAALIRSLLPLLAPGLTDSAWLWSGLLWILAFSLFLLRNLPILTSPRADGKPG